MIADYEAKKEEIRAKFAEEVEEFWSEIDPDATGFLTLKQFDMLYNVAKGNGKVHDLCGPDVDLDDMNAIFSALDTNNNGKIEMSELIAGMAAKELKELDDANEIKIEELKADVDEYIEDWFNDYDNGKKGYLDKADFRKWYDYAMSMDDYISETLGEMVNYKDFETLFSFFDSNGNGKIDREVAFKIDMRIKCVAEGVPPPPM